MFSTWGYGQHANWQGAAGARSDRERLAIFLAGVDRLLVGASAALFGCLVLLVFEIAREEAKWKNP